jgi:hypothetical protein
VLTGWVKHWLYLSGKSSKRGLPIKDECRRVTFFTFQMKANIGCFFKKIVKYLFIFKIQIPLCHTWFLTRDTDIASEINDRSRQVETVTFAFLP